MTATSSAIACERCALPLAEGDLMCPRCGALVYRTQLEQLSQEAMRLEAVNPLLAADAWRKCLRLLPPEAPQFQWIATRLQALGAGPSPDTVETGDGRRQPGRPPILGYRTAPAGPAGETWQSVLLKTGGSMALSMMLFASMDGWAFAVGLVLLIFVHEMGHVIANWYFGVRQSPPIFLGIFGAVIFLRGNLRNAWEEAVMGIAGPLLGTVGAMACYWWYLNTGNPLAGELAAFGCFINLFNLIPITPLDGGRATSAITPFLWGFGLVGLVGYQAFRLVQSFSHGGPSLLWLLILFYILRSAWPRVRQTLFEGGWRDPYFKVGVGHRVLMSAIYAGLAVLLSVGMALLRHDGYRIW